MKPKLLLLFLSLIFVGGSELWQLVDYYSPYIPFSYQPRKIFIYAGENDIASRKSPQFVGNEFTKLRILINQKLPNADLFYVDKARYSQGEIRRSG